MYLFLSSFSAAAWISVYLRGVFSVLRRGSAQCICILVLVSLAELQLPQWILSLSTFFCRYSCDFSFALLFRRSFFVFVFYKLSYFTVYTLRLRLILESKHFRTLYTRSSISNRFHITLQTHTYMHTYIRPPDVSFNLSFSNFHLFFLLLLFFFLATLRFLAKQFSHANFKWNRIQLLLSRRGARDRKVEARKRTKMWPGEDAADVELALRELWNSFRYWTSDWAIKAEQVSERALSGESASLHNENSTQFQSLPVFTVLSHSLSLSAPLRSQLIWDLCERRSVRTVWLISSLSHISFSFSICVEKFIHALLLFECACCLLPTSCCLCL